MYVMDRHTNSPSSRRGRSPNRNVDKSKRSPRKTDKSLLDILSEISKLPTAKELRDSPIKEENHVPVSQQSTIRLHQEYSGSINGFPSTQNISSAPDLSAWNQMLSRATSSTPAVKTEVQMKREGAEELDELSKMMMILHGDSPSKLNIPQSSNMATLIHKLSPQPVPPVYHMEDEIKMEATETESHQKNLTLSEQRDEYLKKADILQKKIDTLKYRRDELRGDGQRSPSPDTKVLLKENTKLQLVHQNKLKNINNLIDMLTGIIGDKVRGIDVSEASDRNLMRESKTPAVRKFNYTFYDSELHWCRVCDIFPPTATDYLNHLHSHDHKSKISAAQMEAPWHSLVGMNESFPTYPLAETKRTPIKGLQFFVPSTAWYCKLCDQFTGDLHCASAHLKSVTHSKNYNIFVQQNPHWETDWLMDRQKALEEMRMSVNLKADDSFNIEGMHGTLEDSRPDPEAQGNEDESNKRKYLSSTSSSSFSDSESENENKNKILEEKAVPNKSEIDDPPTSKVSRLDRLDPLINDRKLLENINSTKIQNRMSPPRAYRIDNRVERNERTDLRRDNRRFDHRNDRRFDRRFERLDDRRSVVRGNRYSVQREDRRFDRHQNRRFEQRQDRRSMRPEDRRSIRREDRSSVRREDRSFERRKGRSSERHRDRSSERHKDRSSERRAGRSSERREDLSSEQRTERRSELSDSGQTEKCSERCDERRSEQREVRSEERSVRRDKTSECRDDLGEDSSSDDDEKQCDEQKVPVKKKSVLIGKILPFKIMPLHGKEEQKIEDQKKREEEEEIRKRQEEMDAEIKKKVEEFKEQLTRIQEECQKAVKLTPAPPPVAPAPPTSAPPLPPTAPALPATPAPPTSAPAPPATPAPGAPAPAPATPAPLDLSHFIEMTQQVTQQFLARAQAPGPPPPPGTPDPLLSLAHSILGLPPPMSMPPVPQPMNMPSPMNIPPNMGIPPLMGMRPFMPRYPRPPGMMPMPGPKIRPFRKRRQSFTDTSASTRSKDFKKALDIIFPEGDKKVNDENQDEDNEKK